MNIYIGKPVNDYTAMQWPAPDGFHVPLRTEWEAIVDAGTSLWAWSSSNGVNLSTYLKLPMTGYRYREDLSINGRGLYGQYLISTSGGKRNALFLNFDSSYISVAATERSTGMTVRCLKDSPVIPTASWTILYQWSWNAWIFHNPTDWLISISSDGTTWYTLMDKNLWATTVYNYWDTLSYANCGNYYQRWNNYWFWENASQITKSSTQVNVTWYGPWNYYKSSTWITTTPRQSSVNDWDNLRWWVTGVVTKSQEVQNIYIGEYELPYLYFTANTAWSTVILERFSGSPTSVTLEISTDWTNRSNYTMGSTITLTNIGDKVYWRNTSTTDTWFSTNENNFYRFKMTWSIAWSGDITYLLNKNWTTILSPFCFTTLFYWCTSLTTAPLLPATTLGTYCYYGMFNGCSSLTTTPSLPATTLDTYCYNRMFYDCTELETLPELPATTLANYCYNSMFNGCSKIKLSTTKTWDYQTAYRIPTTWTWTSASYALSNMFYNTWWTFTGTPSINTTYYTSNTVV